MAYPYHTVVIVSDFQKSLSFYDGLFEQLGGWRFHFADDESKAYTYTESNFSFWIVQSRERNLAKATEGLGLNHLAFRVKTKEAVDECYDWLNFNHHGTIDIEPKFYPEYSPNYYALFFNDPDGTRLEVCVA